jgi:perosamine synthetase
MKKLAINGGKPVRNKKFHPFPNVGFDDLSSILTCFENSSFSGFRAGFYDGGSKVKSFENIVSSTTGSKYAVSFDTWSNGIVACLMSMGIESGDEVLITPYTMTSCATSVLACGALPVFVDVCLETGCLDPDDVERKITDKTKAIFVVHLFGIPADMDRIMSIANKHDLLVFEDCAQSPLATYKGKLVGTMGHVSGFSLTESKHIMSGEGGVAITDNELINNGMRIVRNHGEVKDTANTEEENYTHNTLATSGLIGFNFRMTELTAALAESQWKKLPEVLDRKHQLVNYLHSNLSRFSFIEMMKPDYECSPSWYSLPLRFKSENLGISRSRFVEALNAEGMNFAEGYVEPLYYQSIYTSNPHWVVRDNGYNYSEVRCKNVEKLWRDELILTLDVRLPYTISDMDDIIRAFEKIETNIHELI